MLSMYLHWIFLLNICASFVQGNLTIARYNQLDSNTTCREGLRIGEDTAILKAQANIKTNSTTINFSYSMDGETFIHLCLVKTVCGGAKGFFCYCDYIDDNNISHVVIKMPAKPTYSEAWVRGSYQSQFSEPQRYPKMYNTSNIKLHLNGKLVPSLNVVYEMNDYQNENQICCVDAPSPCVVELVTQHANVSTGETCVSFHVEQTRYTEDIKLTVKYYVCNVKEGELTLQFRSHAVKESPEIILSTYEQEDAQPVCKEGLRHDTDKFVFKARASLTHKSWRVKFIVKRSWEKIFLDFCNVSLPNGNDHSTKDRCYHADTDSSGTHHIVVNLTADIQYSDAQIQGVLVDGTSSIYSEVQIFPKIYDTSSINHTINGRPVSTLLDDLELTTPLDDLRVCCGDSPLPCRARINYEQLEMADTPCVITTLGAISNHDNITFELGFDVCGVSEKNVRVNIQKWRDSSTKGNNASSFNYTENTNYTVSYEETSTNTQESKSFTLTTFHLIIAAIVILVPITVVSLLVYCVQVKQSCRKISANSRYSILFLPSSRPVRQERESLHIYESIDDTLPRHTTQLPYQHVSMRKRMAKDDSYRNFGTDYFDSEECLYDKQRRLPPMTVLNKRRSRSMDDVGYLDPIDFHQSYSRSLPRIPK